MKVRSAKVQDVKAINALINEYAEQDKMLFPQLEDLRLDCTTATPNQKGFCC